MRGNSLSADHVARLQAELDKVKDELRVATAVHAEALAAAMMVGAVGLGAARTAATLGVVGFALRAEGASAGLLDMDALKLLDQAEVGKLTMDDAGEVAGAKPLIEAMKKAKPFLFGTGNTSGTAPAPAKTPPAAKRATEMTDDEFKRAMKNRAWRTG
ncbi:MAG: hypothetical protein ACHQIO_16740 [Nevskiales bacterium]